MNILECDDDWRIRKFLFQTASPNADGELKKMIENEGSSPFYGANSLEEAKFYARSHGSKNIFKVIFAKPQ